MKKEKKKEEEERKKEMAAFEQSPDFLDFEAEEQEQFRDAEGNLRMQFSRDSYFVYINRKSHNGVVSNFSLSLANVEDILIKEVEMKAQCSNTNEIISAIKGKVFTLDEATTILAEKNPILVISKELNLGFQSNIFNAGGGGLKPSTTFRLYKSVVVNRTKPTAMTKIYFSNEGINMSTFELSNFLEFLQKIKNSANSDVDASVESG